MKKFKVIKKIIPKKMQKKSSIPLAIRQQVWLKYIGKKFDNKCNIIWCQNNITVFRFHVGHVIPKSKGGSIEIENLRPICSNCNLSMSNKYTIDEWNIIGYKHKSVLFNLYVYLRRFCNY